MILHTRLAVPGSSINEGWGCVSGMNLCHPQECLEKVPGKKCERTYALGSLTPAHYGDQHSGGQYYRVQETLSRVKGNYNRVHPGLAPSTG